MSTNKPPLERWAERVHKTAHCWIWTGGCNDRGYPRLTIDYKIHGAHRWAYEHFVGPIPAGMTVDHLCHNADPLCQGGTACPHRRCVNPAHLEPASIGENTRRARQSRDGFTPRGAYPHQLAADVRAWARANGIPVGTRGRIHHSLFARYALEQENAA